MMAQARTSHERFLFASCAVGDAKRTWFLVEDDPVFRVLQFSDGKWIHRKVPFEAAALCGNSVPETLVVGTHGEIMRGSKQGFTQESVDPEKQRPEKLGVIRDIRYIGGGAFAAGMARQVYRRTAAGVWQLVSEAILATRGSKVSGFNAIGGTSEDDVIAVGFQGEIWRFDGATWREIESPTNVSLNRVRCADNSVAYACGQAGVLLELKGDSARPLVIPSADENYYGLEVFKKKIYTATLSGLFKLEGGKLLPVDMGFGSGVTTGSLEAGGGRLWSVGANHIAVTTDGMSWQLVTCPL